MSLPEYALNLSYVLLGFLQEPSPPTGPQWLANWQKGADIFNKLVTAFAVIVGAIWAYYRFGTERTHKSNLELTVSGQAVRVNGVIHLRVTTNAKNIGSSKIGVFHPFSGFRVLGRNVEADAEGAKIAEWTSFDTWDLLADQIHLEPREPAVDTHLILIPQSNECVALKLEVYISASSKKAEKLRGKLEEKGLEGLKEKEKEKLKKLDSWVSTSIVNPILEGDNTDPSGKNGRA